MSTLLGDWWASKRSSQLHNSGVSSFLPTWTRRCWQSPSASAAFNCLLVIDTVLLKSFLVSQSLSPDLQSLPDLIQTNSVQVVCSNIKSLYLDVTTGFWSPQFQVAVLRSVISHWGITFPADQELFPKHDLDGNFHNAAFLKSPPQCCREAKPAITEHSVSDQQWPDSGSHCCCSSRGCCLTPNPNKYFILAKQGEKEEKQTRWPFSADTTTGRGELQSHDHWHKVFCQCATSALAKTKP